MVQDLRSAYLPLEHHVGPPANCVHARKLAHHQTTVLNGFYLLLAEQTDAENFTQTSVH